MAVITKDAILDAVERIKNVNVWAVSDNVHLTFDDETGQVIVWNAEGDYDAWYAEDEIDLILAEAQAIEDFYMDN